MPDFENIRSRQYRPDPEKCCSACVFGEGMHADFCGRKFSLWGFPVVIDPSVPKNCLQVRDKDTHRLYGTFSLDSREARNLRDAMGSDL